MLSLILALFTGTLFISTESPAPTSNVAPEAEIVDEPSKSPSPVNHQKEEGNFAEISITPLPPMKTESPASVREEASPRSLGAEESSEKLMVVEEEEHSERLAFPTPPEASPVQKPVMSPPAETEGCGSCSSSYRRRRSKQ